MTQILIPYFARVNVTANNTVYGPVGSGVQNTNTAATDAQTRMTWRVAGSFSGLYSNVRSNNVTATSTATYRVGGVNGNQTISVGSSATGEFQDTTHTDTVAAGDGIDIQYVAGATGTNISFGPGEMLFSPTTAGNTVNKLMYNPGGTSLAANATYFVPISGQGAASKSLTEANVQFKNKATATLQNMAVSITSNTVSASSTIKTRVAGADGNISVSIGSNTAGQFEDTTHTDSIVSGNLINYSVVAGATGTSISIEHIAVDYLTTDGNTHYITSISDGANYATYFAISAGNQSGGIENALQRLAQLAFTASNLETFVVTNTTNGAITFRKNAGNGNQTISINATGYFEDSTNTDSITATDEINYTRTGSAVLGSVGILAAYTAAAGNTVTETVTETDSSTIIATDVVSFTETQTETDSYASAYYWTNTLTETQTESDSAIIIATDRGLDSESNTTTDAINGAATGLTNLNETGNVTDTHQGVASGLGLFTESNSVSDIYSSSQTQPGQNNITETVTESDSLTIAATDVDVISELVAANDNYDCQQTIFGAASTQQTGPGDDNYRRRKYLDWLRRQKKKRKPTKLEKNQNRYAEKVIPIPKPEAPKDIKPEYRPSEQAARAVAIDTILALLPMQLSPIVNEAPYYELLELINELREEEDEEAFMMLM